MVEVGRADIVFKYLVTSNVNLVFWLKPLWDLR